MTSRQTSYEKAILEYDAEHETVLMEAITTAIFDASKVSDCNAIIVRTGEAANALMTVLAGVLAMSPSVTRSPTAIRQTTEEIGKRLRRKVSAAEQNEDVQDFVRRVFRGGGTVGSA